MKGSPAFQWYPKDYLSSGRVAVLTLEEEGAYRRALDFCWLDGSIPADPKQLALLIGKGCTDATAAKVQTMFTKQRRNPAKLVHARLMKERVKQAEFIAKCRDAGSKSWDARKNKNRVGSTNPNETLQPKVNSAISNLQSPICNNKEGKPAADKFQVPTIEEVKFGFSKTGLPEIEAVKFFNFYESKGWMVGKNKMKSLNGAIGGWAARYRDANRHTPDTVATNKPLQRWQIQKEIDRVELEIKAQRRRRVTYTDQFKVEHSTNELLPDAKEKIQNLVQQRDNLKRKYDEAIE